MHYSPFNKMKRFILLFFVSVCGVPNVFGQLPHEIPIDSQPVIDRLRKDATDYCDKKCHANPENCERDPNRRSMARCIESLYWVHHYNYQVCAEDCRPSCKGRLDDCNCRNFCLEKASEVIRRSSKSPKELVQIWNNVRQHPLESQYRGRNGKYNYIGN